MNDKDHQINAAQLSNKKLLTCSPDTPLYVAARKIKQRKTSSILVKQGGNIVGIWTEADCAKFCFANTALLNEPISDFMSSPVISIEQHLSVQEIIMAFHRHNVRHLLVTNNKGEPIGITSQTDVIKEQGVERYLQLRKIKENFNPRVPVIAGCEPIDRVAKKMASLKSTSAIIAQHEGDGYGIVTERDLLFHIADRKENLTAWQVATSPLLTIDINDSLFNAYSLIKEHDVRHLVVYDEGRIVGTLSLQHILSDIEVAYVKKLQTVLHERDNALKESRKNLSIAEKIIEESLDSIMVSDKNGVIISVNPAFTLLTGYEAEEAVGRNASMLSSGFHDHIFYQEMWQEISEKGTWQGEILNKKKSGEIFSEWLTIVRLAEPEDDSQEYYAAIFSDITERKLNEKRIHALAFYDELTGLPNRRLFNDRFEVAISTAHRNNQHTATLFLDLDRFKQINDSLGHKTGDELLKLTANRIQACIKEGDTVSRFGGDEFVVLLTEMNNPKDIVKVVERISKVLSEPYELESRELHVTSSIGVAIYPEDGTDPETLIKHADAAMYKAKDNGRNAFQLFSPEMNMVSMERLIMQNSLRSAIKKNEFTLHYQLKYEPKNNRVAGIEALIRWEHEELGRVSPAQFIPLAEEAGLIVEIDNWVLNEACRQRMLWLKQGIDCGPISVNISAIHFNHDLVYTVEQALERTGLPSELLEIEVTEGCFIKNMDSARAMLGQISALGVKRSIDDFGTGYSSLGYLTQLPFDTIKIDASFIAKVPMEVKQNQIVSAIIAMSHALEVDLVAEGVESQEQVEFLSSKGCFVYQGYLYSRPLAAKDCTAKLISYNFLPQQATLSAV